MIDFRKHSLKNYTRSDIDLWQQRGIENVARLMGINPEHLKNAIELQESIIAERDKNPTINDNSPERCELRDKILKDYADLYPYAVQDKRAVIVLGQIASGKTSFCNTLEGGGRNIIVDVDFIKQGHGKMEALKNDFDEGRGTNQIHEEASMLSKKFLNKISDYGYNVVIPKTGIEFSSINKIASNLKSKGYNVELCYIDLPIEKCVERNFGRYVYEMLSGKPSRLIPIKTIEMIDDKPFKTFCKFMRENSPYIDGYYAYSNDVEQGEEMLPLNLEEMLVFDEEEEKNEEN